MSQNQLNKNPAPSTGMHDELVLAVKRDDLFAECPAWQGLNRDVIDHVMHVIEHKKEFIPRHLAENDPSYKQIIPYLLFRYGERYFLMQRQSTASETRLQNKYSLGIGGHIRQDDIQNGSIFSWAHREFHEEVTYRDAMNFRPIGVINDDSTDVGAVHLGLVIVMQGQTPNIQIKSELKSGKLLNVRELEQYHDLMESWSQILLTHMAKNPRLR